jgi:hypothetical protein
MKLRNGSSMIELVIAIVIMGIAIMTLPMMLTTVQNNNNFALQQEAILMARTQLGDIMTYPWDEHSEDSSFNVGILDTNGDNDFNRTNRIGLVKANKRRKFFTLPTSATAPINLGQDTGDYDDIDDFNTKNMNLSIAADTNATIGYKIDSNMTISVKYIDDNTSYPLATFDFNASSTPADTTNIKMIEVSLHNSQLDGNITLRAFSSNIGANQLLRRTF